jgi:hypothetical protein
MILALGSAASENLVSHNYGKADEMEEVKR